MQPTPHCICYVARAVECGLPAAVLTDHGVLYGALDWYAACRRAGIKPILGLEAYYASTGVAARDKHQHHLLLLARDEAGYRNLLWLTSMATTAPCWPTTTPAWSR